MPPSATRRNLNNLNYFLTLGLDSYFHSDIHYLNYLPDYWFGWFGSRDRREQEVICLLALRAEI